MEELGELSQALIKGFMKELPQEAADNLYVSLGTILTLDQIGADGCKFVIKKNDKKRPDNYIKSGMGKFIQQHEEK